MVESMAWDTAISCRGTRDVKTLPAEIGACRDEIARGSRKLSKNARELSGKIAVPLWGSGLCFKGR